MKLSVHHVGGRNGTVPAIENWHAFWPIIDLTLYEADNAAIAKAQDYWRKRGDSVPKVHISPKCLGEFEGASVFYLCFDGSSSSMLAFDPACSEYSFFTPAMAKGVYKLGEMAKAKVVQVNVWPLSTLIKAGEVSAPDVLSIDAEGAALQILRGTGDENLKNVAGLFIEASLIPIHKNEAPLHDVLKYLWDRGFLCISFGQIGRYSMAEMHVGGFDQGPQSHIEDALFLRNPATVSSPEALEKLALVAILCGAVSIAYECFKKLDASMTAKWLKQRNNVGLSCLSDFYRTWRCYKDLKLPKFNETHTAEVNNHRHYSSAPPSEDIVARWKASYIQSIPKYQASLDNFYKFQRDVPTHEVLYEKYALHKLAEAAKAERIRHIEFLKNVLQPVY